MATKTEATEILRTFLAEETAGRGGKYWQMNWFRVEPIAAKAGALLGPEEVERFFFHFLQRRDTPPAVPQTALPRLLAAWRALLPKRERGGYHDEWHVQTFVFGFTHEGTTPGELRDAATLKARLKLVTHLEKFSHLPGVRAKRPGFLAFTDQAGHVLDVLRLLRYRLDYGRGENDSYSFTEVRYWGLVFIVLLSRDHRTELLTELLDPGLDLAGRDETMGILNEFMQAVLPECGPDETAFHGLAARLAAQEAARAGETESAALARELGLPYAAGEAWEIVVQAPAAGHTAWYHPPFVKLEFKPDPDWDWHVYLRTEEHYFSEHGGRITQNDGDLPPVGRLAAFPAWLRSLRENHGLAFDFAKGHVLCGRKRSAAKLVLRWLEGG